jgi:peptidoglycan/xylan/chitin deacetylase (PgdA/CDA1 family)
VNQLDRDGYLKTEEVHDLLSEGWEADSHTSTHTSLRSPLVSMEYEIDQSRTALEDLFTTPVLSFSYPYGLTSNYVTRWVHKAGYESAVGLGTGYRHTEKSRYYLSRIEIRSDYSLDYFAGLLPWSGPLPTKFDYDRLVERKCLATRRDLTMECP